MPRKDACHTKHSDEDESAHRGELKWSTGTELRRAASVDHEGIGARPGKTRRLIGELARSGKQPSGTAGRERRPLTLTT
jgi:hypothetical protein